MKLFICTNCNYPVYFENTFCVHCSATLGFDAALLQPVALNVEANGLLSPTGKNKSGLYKYCSNYQYGVCNWLISADDNSEFCEACSLNRTIPDLTNPGYLDRWRAIEIAKHRLVYQLLRMKLPVITRQEDEQTGLVFDFKANGSTHSDERIFTGHDNGVITINIDEADDIEREMARRQMDEVYRTLLGHFRHEIGHYYWDRLIDNTANLEKCRAVFGDDRIDYAEALQKHYEEGAPTNWNEHYISMYATAHPWEDWAETWAHYLHIIDTLETAYSFGLSVMPSVSASQNLNVTIKNDPYLNRDFESIFQMWLPLTFAMNSLNRSMGLKDSYPFVISEPVKQKMKFIHEGVMQAQAGKFGKL